MTTVGDLRKFLERLSDDVELEFDLENERITGIELAFEVIRGSLVIRPVFKRETFVIAKRKN